MHYPACMVGKGSRELTVNGLVGGGTGKKACMLDCIIICCSVLLADR